MQPAYAKTLRCSKGVNDMLSWGGGAKQRRLLRGTEISDFNLA